MAFPQVGGNALTSSATSVNPMVIDLPASVAAGDLVLAFLFSDTGLAFTWPSPWVEIYESAAGTGITVGLGYLIAAGGETSVSVTTSVAERFTAIAVKITASTWHGVTPPEMTSDAVGTSAFPDSTSITASWGSADNLFFSMAAWDNSIAVTVNAYPTSYVDNNLVSADVQSAGRGAICTRGQTVATADADVFTLSGSDDWLANAVVVRPAAGGGFYFQTPFPSRNIVKRPRV